MIYRLISKKYKTNTYFSCCIFERYSWADFKFEFNRVLTDFGLFSKTKNLYNAYELGMRSDKIHDFSIFERNGFQADDIFELVQITQGKKIYPSTVRILNKVL